MRVRQTATRLVAVMLLGAVIVHPQKPCPRPTPNLSDQALATSDVIPSSKASLERRLLLVADNQEHVLTGVQLKSMGFLSERLISSVALRPPLAHVGGRLLLGEALRFGKREGAELVLHLGDATNISCFEELSSVLNLLDREAPRDEEGQPMWFMAPGNHDGMLAGNLAGYQPRLDFRLTKQIVDDFYSRKPKDGLGHNKKLWPFACLSPTNWKFAGDDSSSASDTDMLRKGILTRGDAIRLYLERLANSRKKDVAQEPFRKATSTKAFCKADSAKEDEIGQETICIADTPITCDVRKIEIKSQGYTAIARICPATKVKGKAGDKDKKWVGPFASYIVQKLEVAGNSIILLDTTDYYNPTPFPVPLGGGLTESQQTHADYLLSLTGTKNSLASIDREKVIMAGHHPLDDLPEEQQRWVVERTSRYISAHVHRSTQLVSHNLGKGLMAVDLNIGSTLDYPTQVVVAKMTPNAVHFRVVGADAAKTKWAGFLNECYRRRTDWMLPCKLYKDYRRGTYVNRLLESLTAAAKLAPPDHTLIIPTGRYPSDWASLNAVLHTINNSEGESATFWACQAFYASEATQGEESLREKGERWFGQSPRSGTHAVGKWFPF